MKTCEHCKHKKCHRCGEWFANPEKAFCRNRTQPDGLSPTCKHCVKAATEDRWRKRILLGQEKQMIMERI